ncbi:MAG: hypothetical protein WKF37_00570 [Bryobacteraceae bacterium]
MLRSFVLAALATSLSAAPPRAVTVFVDSALPHSQTISETMQAELGRVVAPLAVQLSWKKLSERSVGEDFEQIVVVRLEGSCSVGASPAEPVQARQRRLASAAVSGVSVLPFASIECNNLKRTIASGLSGQKSQVQEQRLGKAMARVLAHELYHILGATRHHHATGVSKACFGSNELLAEDFSLDNLTLAQMRLAPVEEPVGDLTDSSGR